MESKYVIGVDYGTLSGRALLVRVSDGTEIATAVHEYTHGVIESNLPASGVKLPPDWALQVPSDYIDVLKTTIPAVLLSSGINPLDIIGIATDFTACTPIPVKANGTPLCELPEFTNNPHAYVKLWKHHSAQPHADRITALAHARKENWIARYGGKISSEWEFAKALQVLEEAPEVYTAMDKWVAGGDWIVWQLTGNYVRNICNAGYKGQYQDNAYPSREYCAALNPAFEHFVQEKVEHTIGKLGACAGYLTKQAAEWTGLPIGIPVAVGNVDAHVTCAAANAVNSGQMVAIMGTSTCHIMVSEEFSVVPGMCGVVDSGVIEGSIGYEAGQSGVGDIFAWFTSNFIPSEYTQTAVEQGLDIHEYLSQLASVQPVGAHGLVALDWHSGNRSTLVDHQLSGLILGMTLATKTEDIYRALVESTAYGARKIIETFNENGVHIHEFIAAGGLTKNAFVMQIYADVLNMPITIVRSTQACALGSAIHAATAAGAYANVKIASQAMGGISKIPTDTYTPIAVNVAVYNELYTYYHELYQTFGHNGTMHKLRALRDKALLSVA